MEKSMSNFPRSLRFGLFITSATVLASCTNSGGATSPPGVPDSGKVVLCNASSGTETVSVTVENIQNGPAVTSNIILDPNSTASQVCAAVNKAAIKVGFNTNYSDPNQTGVDIYSGNYNWIIVLSQNVRLDVQNFGNGR
jgi:hypothetical protein